MREKADYLASRMYSISYGNKGNNIFISNYDWMCKTYKKMFGRFLPDNKKAKILDEGCA